MTDEVTRIPLLFRYKPNPDQLESKLGGDSSSSEEKEEGGEGGAKSATAAKFRPPQNVPQFFAESKTGEEMDREGDDILLSFCMKKYALFKTNFCSKLGYKKMCSALLL
jgi:hypothetical protein